MCVKHMVKEKVQGSSRCVTCRVNFVKQILDYSNADSRYFLKERKVKAKRLVTVRTRTASLQIFIV